MPNDVSEGDREIVFDHSGLGVGDKKENRLFTKIVPIL